MASQPFSRHCLSLLRYVVMIFLSKKLVFNRASVALLEHQSEKRLAPISVRRMVSVEGSEV